MDQLAGADVSTDVLCRDGVGDDIVVVLGFNDQPTAVRRLVPIGDLAQLWVQRFGTGVHDDRGAVGQVGGDVPDVLNFDGLRLHVLVVEQARAIHCALIAGDDAVDSGFTGRLGGPSEGSVGKRDRPASIEHSAEERRNLFALGDRVRAHERPPSCDLAEVVQRLGVPAGYVVKGAVIVVGPDFLEFRRLLG